MNTQFAGASSEKIALHADDIANVEQRIERKIIFRDGILLDVNLKASTVLLQMCESGLSHTTQRLNAACNSHFHAVTQLFSRSRRVFCKDLRNGVRELERLSIGTKSK